MKTSTLLTLLAAVPLTCTAQPSQQDSPVQHQRTDTAHLPNYDPGSSLRKRGRKAPKPPQEGVDSRVFISAMRLCGAEYKDAIKRSRLAGAEEREKSSKDATRVAINKLVDVVNGQRRLYGYGNPITRGSSNFDEMVTTIQPATEDPPAAWLNFTEMYTAPDELPPLEVVQHLLGVPLMFLQTVRYSYGSFYIKEAYRGYILRFWWENPYNFVWPNAVDPLSFPVLNRPDSVPGNNEPNVHDWLVGLVRESALAGRLMWAKATCSIAYTIKPERSKVGPGESTQADKAKVGSSKTTQAGEGKWVTEVVEFDNQPDLFFGN